MNTPKGRWGWVVILLGVWGTVGTAEGFRELYPSLVADSHSPRGDTWPANPIEKKIQGEADKLVLKPGTPAAAYTCARQPNFVNFFSIRAFDGPARTPAAAKLEVPLNGPAQSVTNIFRVLRHTEIGAAILDKFAPRYGFDIRVKPIDPKKMGELRRGSAEAVFDIEEKTIHVDLGSQLGKVAFVFLHEVVHSLDDELAKGYELEKVLRGEFDREMAQQEQRSRSRDGFVTAKESGRLAAQLVALRQFQDIRLYRAERFAYDASYKVWQELAHRFPAYYSEGDKRPTAHTDAWLMETLGVAPQTIAAFERGNCRVMRHLDQAPALDVSAGKD